jgi:hypothetical protein
MQVANAAINNGNSINGYFRRSSLLYVVVATTTSITSVNIKVDRLIFNLLSSIYFSCRFIPVYMVKNAPAY